LANSLGVGKRGEYIIWLGINEADPFSLVSAKQLELNASTKKVPVKHSFPSFMLVFNKKVKTVYL
jgi:hypothetical protein